MYPSASYQSKEVAPFFVSFSDYLTALNQKAEENRLNNNSVSGESLQMNKVTPPPATISEKVLRRIKQTNPEDKKHTSHCSSFSSSPLLFSNFSSNNNNTNNNGDGDGSIPFVGYYVNGSNSSSNNNNNSDGTYLQGAMGNKTYEYMAVEEDEDKKRKKKKKRNKEEKKEEAEEEEEEEGQRTGQSNIFYNLAKGERFKTFSTDFNTGSSSSTTCGGVNNNYNNYNNAAKSNFNSDESRFASTNFSSNVMKFNNLDKPQMFDVFSQYVKRNLTHMSPNNDNSAFVANCSNTTGTCENVGNYDVNNNNNNNNKKKNNYYYYSSPNVEKKIYASKKKHIYNAKKTHSVIEENKKRWINSNIKCYVENKRRESNREGCKEEQILFFSPSSVSSPSPSACLPQQTRSGDDNLAKGNQIIKTTAATAVEGKLPIEITSTTTSRLNELRERLCGKEIGQSYYTTSHVGNTLGPPVMTTTANIPTGMSSVPNLCHFVPLNSSCSPSFSPSPFYYSSFLPTEQMGKGRYVDNSSSSFFIGEPNQRTTTDVDRKNNTTITTTTNNKNNNTGNIFISSNNTNNGICGISHDVYFPTCVNKEVKQSFKPESSSVSCKKQTDVISHSDLSGNMYRDSKTPHLLKKDIIFANNKNNNNNNNKQQQQQSGSSHVANKSRSPQNVFYKKSTMTHIVFDTSSLLDTDNMLLDHLAKKNVICIPFDVITELDALNSKKKLTLPENVKKNKEQEEKDCKISFRCRRVRDWIITAIEKGESDNNVRVQRRCEVEKSYDCKVKSKDDSILGFAVFLEQCEQLNVKFVTNDKFLRVKAISELKGNVYSFYELIAHLNAIRTT